MSEADAALTAREFQEAGGTQDWRVLGNGACAWFDTSSHREGAALARRVQDVDVDVRARGVRVRLPLGPTDGGFTQSHVARVRTVSEAAVDLGLRADPVVLQDVELAFDVTDQGAVSRFWQAVLGYAEVGEEGLLDPLRRHPPIWFQQQDAPRPLRNRLHLDAVTPQESAAAAVEAGRRLGARSVAEHGYYATVADPEGNEVDLLPLPEGADRWEGAGTEDWRLVFSAMVCYQTAAERESADLVDAVAVLADDAGLPLGIDVRPGLVVIDSGKDMWEQDTGYEPLAARIQAAARGLGLRADLTQPRFVQVVIDAVDISAVRGFWRAVLGYEEDLRDGVTDIVDPRLLGMPLVFQHLDVSGTARREQRNRIHLDVFVPDDQARARVEAGLAAGGRIVADADAPFGVTLTDPEGNEVDIAVRVGREGV